MNYNAAVRYARTMTTSAQNAGRYEAFRRAKDLGVDLTIEWSATLDHRTRHEHRQMHGQRRDVDEPFIITEGGRTYEIRYPADCSGTSNAPQKEIWNCRCTLLSWVKGFEGDTVTESPKMGDMSFEEWREAKAVTKPYPPEPKSDFTSSEKPVTIQLSDIQIPRSVGAKRRGEGILDLATGEYYDLVDGSRLQNVTVFAGKGTRVKFYDAEKYVERYGGTAENWQHVKGLGLLDTPDGHIRAEIHWS